MWLLRNVMVYSLGSVVLGVLTTLGLAVLVMLVMKGLRRDAQPSPVGWLAGGVMVVGLLFQSVLFFGARRVAGTVDEYEDQLTRVVKAGTNDTQATLAQLKDQDPVIWYFIAHENYDQLPLPQLPHAMATDARAALNAYAWRRVWWGLAFLIVGTTLLLTTYKRRRGGGTGYGFDDTLSTTDYGFGDNYFPLD